MKSRRARAQSLLTFTLLIGVLLGCGLLKKKPGPAPSASAAVAVAPPPPPAVSVAVAKPAAPVEPPPVTDEAIPTAEDFEDEAFEKVTDSTYKPELDTLRKEIEGK
jgi:hypothetical protein